MIKFVLQSQTGYKVSIESPDIDSSTKINSQLIGSYLPGVELVDNAVSDYAVHYHESNEKELIREDGRVIIKDNWHGQISLDLWHLLYSIFRLNYISHNLFPIHASCVGRDHMSLLVGHTGMGKTTLTLRLVNDFGWKIFSGNKTFVKFDSGIIAAAGTKTISIRSSDSQKYPNLFKDETVFSNRTAFDLPDHFLSTDSQVAVKSIFQVRIDDGQNQTSEFLHPSSLHMLYPFFIDSVYADTVMCDGNHVFSGNIDDKSKDLLSRSLKNSLNYVKVFDIKGSVEYLLNQITALS